MTRGDWLYVLKVTLAAAFTVAWCLSLLLRMQKRVRRWKRLAQIEERTSTAEAIAYAERRGWLREADQLRAGLVDRLWDGAAG